MNAQHRPFGLVLAGFAALTAFLVACEDGTPAVAPAASRTIEATTLPAVLTPTAANDVATSTPDVLPIFAPLTLGDPATLPEGVAIYLVDSAEGHGPLRNLLRVRWVEDEIWTARMWERPFQNAWISDGSIYVSECVAGLCSEEHSSSTASVSLHATEDDGRTWRSLGTRIGGGTDPRLWSDVLPEEAAPLLDRSREGEGLLVVDGVELDLATIDLRGKPADGFDAYGLMGWPAVSEHGFAVSWYVRVRAGQSPIRYLSVFAPDGSPWRTFATNIIPVWLDEGRLIGSAVYGGEYPLIEGDEVRWIASIVDIQTKTVHPILDPFAVIPGSNMVIGVRSTEDDGPRGGPGVRWPAQ
ncbi:MAG: hypothetical protein Q8M79_11955 [Dehalococcoidia bacterium]|nr:hypothetical protein [Dehalococcoidia bacterium]